MPPTTAEFMAKKINTKSLAVKRVSKSSIASKKISKKSAILVSVPVKSRPIAKKAIQVNLPHKHHLTESMLQAIQHGVAIDHPFTMIAPSAKLHREKFMVAAKGKQPGRYKVDDYVHNMTNVGGLIETARKNKDPQPFQNSSIFMIQHLTAEVLGTISVLRSLGCKDLVAVFVGYNQEAEEAYRPDLLDLPSEEFRCFILANSTAKSDAAQGIYSVKDDFTKLPKSEKIPYAALNSPMKEKKMTFIDAMRTLCVYTFFQQLARTAAAGKEMLILEDGGYVTPILNDGNLLGKTINEVREQYSAPADKDTDSKLGTDSKLSDILTKGKVRGSVEYTRNGYDHDYQTQLNNKNKLFIPNMTVALSYKKTQIEASGVAESCLNAIDSALNSYGMVMKHRSALVIGSRGNIGRWFLKSLYARLDRRGLDVLNDVLPKVVGCDLKVKLKTQPDKIPSWQKPDNEPSIKGLTEVFSYKDLDENTRYDLDLIIGITGGPAASNYRYQTMDSKDLQDWVAKGNKSTLFIASGSTKTDEFPALLAWANDIIGKTITIDNKKFSVTKLDLNDALTSRSFGSRIQFVLNGKIGDDPVVKNVIFLNNLMPINFLFYAVPTEIIDETLAQLLSITVNLHYKAPQFTGKDAIAPRVFAIDYDRIASDPKYVYGVKPPAADLPLPPP